MKAKDLVCILFVWVECGLNLTAQTRLNGTVVDRDDHPLTGVLIDFSNSRVKTTSDNDEKFTISYPDTLKNHCMLTEQMSATVIFS